MKTRKLITAVGIAAAVALLAAVAIPVFAQRGEARGGDRGQRGMMGDMMYLERSWTAVSFQLECTDEQISQLYPIYALALQERNEAIKQAAVDQDREGYVEAIEACRTVLETKLQDVLTELQWQTLQEIMQPARRGGQR
ncbi:MAG: hypothetical protein ACLFWB_09435 [Armatimonadota bacterium]